ncbi:4-oxalomesaconate tautomerase [Shumkonia mesophila]|uniref:4-oxalomesaconate tautomerase n=1 Tax=Shumkonia mesophila TaxID=2838854 RepID=UPI0029352B3E|nr:4-oxalomesaconate tautomerase [Shumkonia mesophila]
MSMQARIPATMMRGGTSKGLYFRAEDLPGDVATRDRILLAAMGSPDLRQIDGVGGADPLTSKVAIVSPSTREGADVDYLFCQVVVNEAVVDTKPNCGNMLAGVGPFAIEKGMVKATDAETVVRIFMVNSEMIAEATIQTPGGRVDYDGDVHIDGVPGEAAGIPIAFLDTEGSACGALLPTGNLVDTIDGIDVTLIDNGMPVVVLEAAALGRTGYESREAMNADADLKKRLESIRLQAGPMMNLGDVANQVVPKMSLVAPPRAGGSVCTRTFIPHVCHSTIGVLGAVTVATACVLPGSVGARVAKVPDGRRKRLSVEHPTGEFSVDLEVGGTADAPKVERAALLRTARPLFEGAILVPARAWGGTV